jgi:hypothetical protein
MAASSVHDYQATAEDVPGGMRKPVPRVPAPEMATR